MDLSNESERLRRSEQENRKLTNSVSQPPGTTALNGRSTVPETIDGSHIQVLELRGTIIRLREQLDRVHLDYEEKVQRLESVHRAQRRELEETIRHLRGRLHSQQHSEPGR